MLKKKALSPMLRSYIVAEEEKKRYWNSCIRKVGNSLPPVMFKENSYWVLVFRIEELNHVVIWAVFFSVKTKGIE